ncbi:PTS sugar transporter subunit IIA [Streptomyces smyrnaeus]|uniref:PTS sugar transporter subunit IIA n=1 Tax=Streptomyces TaxID=1883 RepID=UPI000C18D2F6|nr:MULTISPECIES: PTS sugar transporter subunit IIA [unclassified Streptomyces]MBQ0862398.1 PTS sugar transporter subunit IIA [Streptomyces sp. RK75]MBQ1124711.1 PTS sugar transporter subunit IIA [Streptomyces sp. B15]MBQ1161326.1 PTS sugar transporter subunit IIA [Streptomyces sp. A73]
MASLSELLPPEAIRLEVTAADWRGALRAAGELLVTRGVTTDAYTDEMIRNVEENGPYIVIAPGFAFAHARPSPAVRRTGMSWVRLAEPVAFGHETNDPVTLVVALAAEESGAHTAAMAALARLLGDPATEAALRTASDPEQLHRALAEREPGEGSQESQQATDGGRSTGERTDGERGAQAGGPAVQKILTVCGNGVGTSLFLKNTLEQVLDRWGWDRHITVEATDTISAKGKASEAAAILTSREIARTLGDVGVPVKVVEDFTSVKEVDATLRDTYDV